MSITHILKKNWGNNPILNTYTGRKERRKEGGRGKGNEGRKESHNKDLYNKNFKTLKKDIKDTGRRKDIPCSWL